MLCSCFRFVLPVPSHEVHSSLARRIGGVRQPRNAAGKARKSYQGLASSATHKLNRQRARFSCAPLPMAENLHLPPVKIVDLVHCPIQLSPDGFRRDMRAVQIPPIKRAEPVFCAVPCHGAEFDLVGHASPPSTLEITARAFSRSSSLAIGCVNRRSASNNSGAAAISLAFAHISSTSWT